MNKILVDATGSKGWIGGVYYKNNIVYSLITNDWISANYKIIIATTKEFKDIFDYSSGNVEIVCIKYKSRREKQLKILLLSIFKQCKYIYHGSEEYYKWFGKTLIRWIPDFQHSYYPENFSLTEVEKRDKEFQKIAHESNPIVLSSNDALKTFREKYETDSANIYVVPFVSYIAPVIKTITKEYEAKCLDKYDLSKKNYVCIMNQFWKHKNHIIVFKAIKALYEKYDDNVNYIFTGQLEDYRNPEYISEVKSLMADCSVEKRIKLLGFIDRKEQIVIMKNSLYIIQPSLFEGWGTVLEDAKVLDKTVILSDIPVHREQRNKKCVLFNPNNENELSELIKKENKKEHCDSVADGLIEMQRKAKEYSIGFQKLLQNKLR